MVLPGGVCPLSLPPLPSPPILSTPFPSLSSSFVLVLEPKVLHMLSICFPIELYAQPLEVSLKEGIGPSPFSLSRCLEIRYDGWSMCSHFGPQGCDIQPKVGRQKTGKSLGPQWT